MKFPASALAVAGLAVLASALLVTPASAAPSTASFTKVQDWGTGFEGKVVVTNGGSSPLAWNVQFDLPAGFSVSSAWDAQMTRSGQHYTFVAPGWAGSLAPGASHTFGFNGSPGNFPGISNCSLNGGSCGGSTPPPTSTTTNPPPPPPPPGKMPGAPYLYLGWGDPPSATSVMSATGIRSFTMAFMLSSGGCNPAWDGQRPLTGGVDAQTISAIQAAGGSVQISFGGWSGNKLGPSCSSPQAYAGAVQQVINAHRPAVVDFDIENTDEFESEIVQDRILNGLKIVKQNNPNVKIAVTFGTSTTGPTYWGTRLINRSRELAVPIDNYTIMPFDFGGGANMYQNTVNATEGLKNTLKSAFGWSDSAAYAHAGISGMNGLSDQQELTSPTTWQQITDYAKSRGLGRFAYWSVNRDRPCPGGGVTSNCSGIAQTQWQFTRITAGF